MDYICDDVKTLSKKEKIIIVHGASEKRDEIAKIMGIPTKTVISPSGVSSVLTDEKAIEVFLMSYAGLVNKQIVAKMQSYGINAVGLSGIDGRLWQAKAKKEIFIKEHDKVKLLKNNLTGRVETINIKLIRLLVDNGFIPVICPPAISFESEIVNTDNDWAVAVMAGALKIKQMVILFEAPGLLKNPKDEHTIIKTVKKEDIGEYMQFAQGRMKKKLLGAKKAFETGVEKIFWGDGRIPHPVLSALQGKGTVIR